MSLVFNLLLYFFKVQKMSELIKVVFIAKFLKCK